MENQIEVKSFDGLWDEKVQCTSYDINKRYFWPHRHEWVNAHLSCKYHVVAGKGGWSWARVCKKCSYVDCIHEFKESVEEYFIQVSSHYKIFRFVETCKICGKRISTGGWGSCEPSKKALELIDEILEEIGKPSLSDGNYGSGYLCEFPVAVSDILDESGVDAAQRFIKSQFGRDGCQKSLDMYLKL